MIGLAKKKLAGIGGLKQSCKGHCHSSLPCGQVARPRGTVSQNQNKRVSANFRLCNLGLVALGYIIKTEIGQCNRDPGTQTLPAATQAGSTAGALGSQARLRQRDPKRKCPKAIPACPTAAWPNRPLRSGNLAAGQGRMAFATLL